jgi:glycosyltransferase involved in cell wall biosynthesis
MSNLVEFDLVRWDIVSGGLRFLDASEIDALFGPGDWPARVRLQPTARQIGKPFRDTAGDLAGAWLLVPEVAWHEIDGTEILSRTISMCREAGMRVASIFYDLIPIQNEIYSGGRALHEAYLVELTRCDLIVPISDYSGAQLIELWTTRGVSPTPPIVPLLLPDGGFGQPSALLRPSSEIRPWIALVGTVEPRKRQLTFLEAMRAARIANPAAARYDAVVIGSLHPYVASDFNAFLVRNPWVRYRNYASDREIDHTLRGAHFSAFASDDEGYGLPISESLAVGTPCICADFGAMAEIAVGGGCLTVDVRSPKALEHAILQLCANDEEVRRLRGEIARRLFRSWGDYAQELLALMEANRPVVPDALVRACAPPPPNSFAALDATAFAKLATADVLEPADHPILEAIVDEGVRRAWPALLPTRWSEDGGEAAALALDRGERSRISAAEGAYARARAAVPVGTPTRPIFLRLLISTFNRRDFVVANVRWLLSRVLGPDTPDVDVVVVDGGSTDGTQQALSGIDDPHFRLIRCPVNVGMLSGLREAARTRGAEYVWIVGDDDFVRPEGLRAMLKALRKAPGVPLGSGNFAVYHRAVWNPGDEPAALIAESRAIAERVAPTGRISVRQAAEQTDNLFTAIYSIAWRADVLATAFDHAFDGEPFTNLVEAIPSTDMILRRFGDCDLAWAELVLVAGNAHNSWSHWRPRWHAQVMPLAMALAREIGVDRRRLQSWADMHLALFRDAMRIASELGESPRLKRDHLQLAMICFREDLRRELATDRSAP